MEIREEEIPVPWGRISAKIWGKATDSCIICFHGLIDNAGSFDNLIPHLPKPYQYVCIDLPGHGKSSHFPPHLPIYTTSYIIAYTLILEHFQQDKYLIMGHSYGGKIAMLFARMFPKRVDKIIIFDIVYFFFQPADTFIDYLNYKIDKHFKLSEKINTEARPTYTYKEAVKKISKLRQGDFAETEKTALALAERALLKVAEGQYVFTLDPRLQNYINPQHDCCYAIQSIKAKNITCPALIILGNKSEPQQIFMKPILQEYRKMPNVRIEIVEGNHDLHINTPEHAAPYIWAFLGESNKL